MIKLFDEAVDTLRKIDRLAESVAKDRNKTVEDIYKKIDFDPVNFLKCYISPKTEVKFPVTAARTYAEFSNINPLEELKADKKYFTRKLLKYASEDTKGKVYAGGLRHLFNDNTHSENELEDWISEKEEETKNKEGYFSKILDKMAEKRAVKNLYGRDVRGWNIPGVIVYPINKNRVNEEKKKIKERWKKAGYAIGISAIITGLVGIFAYGGLFKETIYENISKETKEPLYLAQIDAETVLKYGNEALIEDMIKGNVNTVVLQVFPDDKYGVYWNSSIAPTKKDLLRDFIDKAHDNNIEVWPWMTTLNMQWVYENNPEWRVKAYKNGKYTTDTGWYKRISPCVLEHREYINNLYTEIALKYDIDGILLQDDLYWGENEGFNDKCKQLFYDEFGTDLNHSILQSDLEDEFYEWRAKQLTDVVKGINENVKKVNPDVKLAVNIYPDSVIGETDPHYKTHMSYIGQNYSQLSDNSDYVVIMTYHKMDKQPVEWIGEITKQAIKQSNPNKIIIKVQGVDWNTNTKISNNEVKQALNLAKINGAKNLGIYLCNFSMSDFDLDFEKIGE